MKISRGRALLVTGILLVVIDQVIKILVKSNMTIGENFNVLGDWFKILFIENEGMAFGMKFGGMFGKFVLTAFRLVLFGFLCWWITSLNRKGRRIKVNAGAGGKPCGRGRGRVGSAAVRMFILRRPRFGTV